MDSEAAAIEGQRTVNGGVKHGGKARFLKVRQEQP